MKTNRNIVFKLLSVSIMTISCQKGEQADILPEHDIDVDFPSEVAFYIAGEQQTKADVTELSSFNTLCITGTMGSSETTKFNTVFSKSGSYYVGGKYWPSSNPSYSFYASNCPITSRSAGAYISADASQLDAVVAYNKYNSSASNYKTVVPLTFNHIFAKIGYCNIIPPTGYTVSNIKVAFSPFYKGTYYMYSGTWTKSASKQITLATTANSTTVNGSYIIPGTYNVSVQYTLSKDSYVETFNKTLSLYFGAAKMTNVNLNLPTSSGEIEILMNISSWNDGGEIIVQ